MSHELYFAHQRAVQTIHGIAIRYRLALIGPRIDVAHSELDPALPEHSGEHAELGHGDVALSLQSQMG